MVSKTIGIEMAPNSIFKPTSRRLQAQQLNKYIYVVEVTTTNQQRVWQLVEVSFRIGLNTAGGLALSSRF